MRSSPGGRIALVVGGLLVAGIALRLVGRVLTPVLPAQLMQALNSGWAMLFGLISPAIAALGAVAILAAVCWVGLGWVRR